jgi:hypothetical protein
MDPIWVTLGLSIVLNILLAALCWYLRQERNDARRANELQAQMIEETRAGNPPFLLNPGVRIVKD